MHFINWVKTLHITCYCWHKAMCIIVFTSLPEQRRLSSQSYSWLYRCYMNRLRGVVVHTIVTQPDLDTELSGGVWNQTSYRNLDTWAVQTKHYGLMTHSPDKNGHTTVPIGTIVVVRNQGGKPAFTSLPQSIKWWGKPTLLATHWTPTDQRGNSPWKDAAAGWSWRKQGERAAGRRPATVCSTVLSIGWERRCQGCGASAAFPIEAVRASAQRREHRCLVCLCPRSMVKPFATVTRVK